MKYLKMLGLAAIAAMALTAFLGASSASATVLCTTTVTTGCAASGWDYSGSIHAVNEGETVLNGTWTDVECKKSTVEGTTSTGGAGTPSGNIDVLTFEECECFNNAGAAHVTVLNKGSLEVHSIAGSHNGTLTGKNQEVTIRCTPLNDTKCIFGTPSTGRDLGTLTASATSTSKATMDANATVDWKSGDGTIFACGGTAIWEANYEVTSPSPLYVSES